MLVCGLRHKFDDVPFVRNANVQMIVQDNLAYARPSYVVYKKLRWEYHFLIVHGEKYLLFKLRNDAINYLFPLLSRFPSPEAVSSLLQDCAELGRVVLLPDLRVYCL